MRLEEFVTDIDFKPGDTVSIEEGPLKGFFGTVKELNDAAQKAKISTTMFGRSTDVEVEYIQIKKVDAPLPEPSGGFRGINVNPHRALRRKTSRLRRICVKQPCGKRSFGKEGT